MNHYRVGLWNENQGSLPDVYFEIRTNASMSVELAITFAMQAAGWMFVRSATVEVIGTSQVHIRSDVTLWGADMLQLRSR